ncbi:MAG: hypothetical protein EXS09_09910 [Gemmataceae bacterium]|nr:hypothetical protein [Gemmataceae bacterium]
MIKPYFRPATWLFLGIWILLLVGGRSRFFQDPGTFWHTSVGDRIIDGGFFDTDPFTFSFGGQKWIPQQWLGECALSVGYRIGGFDTQLLVTATILAGVFTGIGVRLLRIGIHPSLVVLIIACGIAASSGHFHVRPHLATIAGLAIVMVYLADVENGRIPIRRLAWLLPVIWLWSNIHGGVMGGLATIALAIAGWTAARFFKRESPIRTRRDFFLLVALWFGTVAVCFANPYFHRLPISWYDVYKMASLTTIIKEHSAVDLSEFAGITIVSFGVLFCLFLFGTVPLRRFRIVWLLPLVWFVLACESVRHAPLFTMAALVVFVDAFPFSRIAELLLRKKSDLYVPHLQTGETSNAEKAPAFGLPAILFFVALVLQATGTALPVLGRGWARHDPTIWPVELLPELKAHQYDRPQGTRIFCEYNFGGYLIHQTPGYRVFIDDRCELFGDTFLVEYVWTKQMLKEGLCNPAEPFAVWQFEYGPFDFALVEPDAGFDLALSCIQAWEEVKRTKTAVLYRKK